MMLEVVRSSESRSSLIKFGGVERDIAKMIRVRLNIFKRWLNF